MFRRRNGSGRPLEACGKETMREQSYEIQMRRTMTIGAPHDDLETHQYECLCGTIIPGSEAKNYRRVPDVKDCGEIQPYPYGSMKARPYNF